MLALLRLERLLPGATLMMSIALSSTSARALPVFPGDLAKDLDMPCTPECTVCHRDNNGGLGTLKFIKIDGANKPGFGRKMTTYGLDIGKRESLKTALAASEADASDVDGDGTTDVAELRKGDDPNDPTPGATIACQAPESGSGGCGRIARRGPIGDVAVLSSAAVILLGAALLRRRPS